MNAREAQDLALVSAAEIKLDDLVALQKVKMGAKKFFRDADGKLKRRVTLSNFDSKLKIGTHPYKNYEDWEKYNGYHSTQWSDFDLQDDLYNYAQRKTGNTFYSMNEQESYDVDEMPLFPLDIERDVLDDFTTVLIGRRRSGKTWASRWLMYHMRHRFPFGIVITGTRLNNFWAQYVPEEFIHDITDIHTVLELIFARQTFIKAHPELGIDPRMFIILDDVMGDKNKTRHNKELSNIFTNGRHNDVFLLVTLQDAKGIPPDLRENTDLCLIFRVYEGGRKQVICEEWLSYIEEMKEGPARKTLTRAARPNQDTEQTGEEDEATSARDNRGVMRETKQKQHTVMKFFWKNTGLLDKTTCEPFQESKCSDEKKKKETTAPQAIAVLQARTTEDLQAVMKKLVAEDPGPFILGDKDYYKAATTGNYRPIMHTYSKFKRRGKRRVRTAVFGEEGSDEDSAESDGESSSDEPKYKTHR